MVFIALCKEGNYDLPNENYREILSRNSALLLRYFLIKKRDVEQFRKHALLLCFLVLREVFQKIMTILQTLKSFENILHCD